MFFPGFGPRYFGTKTTGLDIFSNPTGNSLVVLATYDSICQDIQAYEDSTEVVSEIISNSGEHWIVYSGSGPPPEEHQFPYYGEQYPIIG